MLRLILVTQRWLVSRKKIEIFSWAHNKNKYIPTYGKECIFQNLQNKFSSSLSVMCACLAVVRARGQYLSHITKNSSVIIYYNYCKNVYLLQLHSDRRAHAAAAASWLPYEKVSTRRATSMWSVAPLHYIYLKLAGPTGFSQRQARTFCVCGCLLICAYLIVLWRCGGAAANEEKNLKSHSIQPNSCFSSTNSRDLYM